MKKIMLLVVSVILVMALTPALALAGSGHGPNYGETKPTGGGGFSDAVVKSLVVPWAEESGELHVVEDPLVEVESSGATGIVSFWCDSHVGFQYHIAVSGLEPNSSYDVYADGEKEGDGPVNLYLGKLQTDRDGVGSKNGVAQLEPGRYELGVTVEDSDGNVVLEPGFSPFPPPGGPDMAGFAVY